MRDCSLGQLESVAVFGYRVTSKFADQGTLKLTLYFTLYSLTVGLTLVGLNVSYVSSSISCFSTRSKLFQSIASGSVTLESRINHSLGNIQLGTLV